MKKISLTLLLIFVAHTFYAQTSKNTKHALIIAIGDYPASTGWGSINSVNDVSLIKQTLLNQNFKEKNIVTLIDSDATKKGILAAFNKIKNS